MKNVLVTGGTGFIGSNLVEVLLREGCSVKVLRRKESDLRALEGLEVESCFGDVRDAEAVLKAVKGCDTVFHAAAIISHWKKERPLMEAVNVGGTRNVVDACLRSGVRRLVHTSSVAAIGFPGHEMTADENTQFNWEPYDIGYRNTKWAAEQEIARGVKLGLDAVMVNPSVVIGPRDIHFHGGQLIRDIYHRRIFYYVSGGMSVVYVGDVVRGHLLAAKLGRTGERYILSGESLSHRQIISTIAEVVGGIKPLFRMPSTAVTALALASESIGALLNKKPWVTRELFAGGRFRYHFSCMKAKSELGYSSIPFRQAVVNTFEWYKTHGLL
ncbi:MAG TPA: nucleoside-diphosphate sugar epimerase [Bacteroidetes bacterium]|nr:nucleoside-diphosphate sugar epimerase [Bacteroidota bacterium]